ncbi:beta-ketoacyl-ACP reductase [Bdellovibrionota bacterium FG-2]
MQTQIDGAKPCALVTGASRGIGASVALRLAKEGFHVLINYSSREDLARATSESIRGGGGSAEVLRFDVSSSEEVDRAFEGYFGGSKDRKLAVLVNNAGINKDGLLARLKDEDLEKTLDVDLKGAIYCTRAAARLMMRARSGCIIQIGSVIGEMGNAGQSAYAAAKSGLIGFSKSVARELASRNVRVNVINPGYIKTEMTGALTDDQKEAILRSIPLGFLGEGEDVASLVAFLASPGSRYITGQVIGINGGMYM